MKKEEGGQDELKKLQRKPIFESNAEPPDDEHSIQRNGTDCAKRKDKLQKKEDEDLPIATPPERQRKPIFERKSNHRGMTLLFRERV